MDSLPSSTLLDGGEIVAVALNGGTTVPVKVRLLPERHLNRFLDLLDVGRESELLKFVLQPDVAPAGEPPRFAPVNLADEKQQAAQAAFVDSLTSDAFAALLAVAEKLNVFRAVSQAERQIARGQALLPLKRRLAETMIDPLKNGLASLISSLTTAASPAAAANPPATNP